MSTSKIDIKYIIIFLCLAALIFFWLDSCGKKKELMLMNNELLNYTDSIKVYKTANGNLAEYNQAVQLLAENKSKEVERLKKDLNLKTVDVLVKYKSIFKYDTINHVFREQLPCDAFVDSFSVDSTFFKFDAVITNKRLSLYNIEVPNQQSIIIGEKKKGWLRSSDYSVVITNSNPNIKGEGLEAYTFKPSPKWYNSYKFKGALFAAGVIGGFLLAK